MYISINIVANLYHTSRNIWLFRFLHIKTNIKIVHLYRVTELYTPEY